MLRWVLVGLGAVLGLVLFVRGEPVIGGILMALALTRVALLVSVQRRRREFGAAAVQRRRYRRIGARDHPR